MALIKEITLGNGITVRYHRVMSIHGTVGHQTTVQVASYTAPELREAEKAGDPEADPYIATSFFNMGYVDGMSASAAYAYLLSLPEFSGAESDEGGA